MPKNTISTVSSLLSKLHKERAHHVAAVDEIDRIFARFGMNSGRPVRVSAGAATGRKRRSGPGSRVQGVKAALAASLSSAPQSPAELAAKVAKRVGAKVSVTTQLHMLKREKVAKSAGRGKWVRA